MAEFTMKANDTRPVIQAALSYADGTVPALTGASVSFIMARPGQAAKVNAAAVIVTATSTDAVVRYVWLPADTDIPAADWQGEWEVTFPDGGKQTFPTGSYHSIEIKSDLDAG